MREFLDLYQKGLSLKDISLNSNIPISTIRDTLVKAGVTLRTTKKSNLKSKNSKMTVFTGQIPYGYCLIEGKLISDPKEQKVINQIIQLWNKGMAFIAIKRWLNEHKIKSKHNRQWNDKTVAAIIRRHIKTNKKEISS